MAEERLKRFCDSCGAWDDHPRHVIATTDVKYAPEWIDAALANVPEDEKGRAVNELMDDSTTMKHLDCCAADGCPDSSCGEQLAGASDAKGADLVNYLTGGQK